MTFVSIYGYAKRQFLDLKTLSEALRFMIVNSILAFIFFFLIVEEFEWIIFSSGKGISDKVIDETEWNIKTLI